MIIGTIKIKLVKVELIQNIQKSNKPTLPVCFFVEI